MFMKSITGEPVHVGLISGHSIVITPEGRDVPPLLIGEVLKSGKVATVERVHVGQDGAPSADALALIGAQQTAQGEKNARIKDAIKNALDAGDETFMSEKGIPDARKLDKLVGEPVSAAERDRAWAELQAEAAGE